jgi:5-methylcytosine-specific restriction endonuclease McrA
MAHKPKKPIKKRGKRTLEYETWRDTVAKPYLDKTYGHVCRDCGATGQLDVEHIKKRGSHPHLKMTLTNVTYLCRPCHIKAT